MEKVTELLKQADELAGVATDHAETACKLANVGQGQGNALLAIMGTLMATQYVERARLELELAKGAAAAPPWPVVSAVPPTTAAVVELFIAAREAGVALDPSHPARGRLAKAMLDVAINLPPEATR